MRAFQWLDTVTDVGVLHYCLSTLTGVEFKATDHRYLEFTEDVRAFQWLDTACDVCMLLIAYQRLQAFITSDQDGL